MTDIDNLELKKRSRRRLVGAAALALLAAIVLPMVMDDEPGVQVQDIQVMIPDRDADGARTRPIAGRLPSGVESEIAPAPHEQSPSGEQKSASESLAPEAASETDRGAAPVPGQAPAAQPSPQAAPQPPAAQPSPQAAARPTPDAGARPTPPAAQTPSEAARVRAILEGRADAAAAPASAQPQFVVQVGAFSEPEKATTISADLKSRGFASYTERAGSVTRVRVGPFPSRDDADSAARRLSTLGMNGVVTTR